MLVNQYRNFSNIRMLELAATKLEEINEKVVFVGGCAIELLITDKAVPNVRATKDVDCIIEIISINEYYKLASQLEIKGFKQDMHCNLTCRWFLEGDLILDVIPTEEKRLGFSNIWYKDAIKHPLIHKTNGSLTLRVIDAPHFIATKLEAFKSRGQNNYLESHDLEDIITVIDGRNEIVNETISSNDKLKVYLQKNLKLLISNEEFNYSLPGHLNSYGSLVDDRVRLVINRIYSIINA